MVERMNADGGGVHHEPCGCDCAKRLVHVYNSGYKAGHHDTVETFYVDIVEAEMDTYHEDIVTELVAELEADHG